MFSLFIFVIFAFIAVAQAQDSVNPDYQFIDSVTLSNYTIEKYGAPEFDYVQTIKLISPTGVEYIVEGWNIALNELNPHHEQYNYPSAKAPTDINGNSVPDLVIEDYSGGAHCCFSYTIIELGNEPKLLLEVELGDSSLSYSDFDSDGSYELIAGDSSFAYEYCSFADSPFLPLVFSIEEDGIYALNNLKWVDDWRGQQVFDRYVGLYMHDVLKGLESIQKQDTNYTWGDPLVCPMQGLVYTFAYMGQPERGWLLFDKLYPKSDKESVRKMLMKSLEQGFWYQQISKLIDNIVY